MTKGQTDTHDIEENFIQGPLYISHLCFIFSSPDLDCHGCTEMWKGKHCLSSTIVKEGNRTARILPPFPNTTQTARSLEATEIFVWAGDTRLHTLHVSKQMKLTSCRVRPSSSASSTPTGSRSPGRPSYFCMQSGCSAPPWGYSSQLRYIHTLCIKFKMQYS